MENGMSTIIQGLGIMENNMDKTMDNKMEHGVR